MTSFPAEWLADIFFWVFMFFKPFDFKVRFRFEKLRNDKFEEKSVESKSLAN